MVEKNKEYIVEILDNGVQGEGIAKIDGFAIFIPNAIKGETVRILILKVNKNFAYGKIVEIIIPSKYRNTEVDCGTYKKCGGCNLRHIKYENTLNMKTEMVRNTLKKALNKDVNVNEIIGMEKPFFYRNKLQYPVGIINDEPVMGVFANRTHTIVPTTVCLIQDKKSQEIANDVFEFIKENKIAPYNEFNQTGCIRHIIVKIGKKTNEVMLILVVNESFEQEDRLIKWICEKHTITTIVKNVNRDNTNVILGKENLVLYGKGYIQDILGGFKFNVSPLAFYQVNPVQTEKLYNKAIDMAELDGTEIAYDLYCGIGTISIFMANRVSKVYGIEIIEEAIKTAKENAVMNDITNAEFLAGDVEIVLPDLIKKDMPDIVFVDPPRKGLDANSIDVLKNIKPKKIVYISCNPATLGRDLKLLHDLYEIKEVQPVDMFPYTSHVECVCVLKLKQIMKN